MPSIYWYSIVAVIGVGVTAFTIFKKRSITKLSTFLMFFLFATCITWIGEFVVLGLFDSYAYKTGIYTSPWAQNILGHLILNSTFYPGTAILVGAYSLGYGWMSIITLIYLLIEYLFIKLGIYEHHWWKYYMTGICIFIYQIFSRFWFNQVIQIHRSLIRICTLYFIGFVILHYPIPILLLLEKQYYNVHWAQDFYLSSTIFIFIYQLIETLIFVYLVCILDKWYWKTVPFILAFVGPIILVKFNILILQNGWNLYNSIAVSFTSLFTFILIEKFTLIPNKS